MHPVCAPSFLPQAEYSADVAGFLGPENGWEMTLVVDDEAMQGTAALDSRPTRVPLSYMFNMLRRALKLAPSRAAYYKPLEA